MTQRDPSGFLPNMLGPVKLEATGVEVTSRGTLNFDNASVIDDPDADRMTIAWGGNATKIGGVAVTGPGDVPVDVADFGAVVVEQIISKLFRVPVPTGGGNVAKTLYTIPIRTDVDIVVTTVFSGEAGTLAYFRDHRFRGGRSSVGTPRTDAITESTAILTIGSDFDDGNDYAVLTRSGNDLILTLLEVPGQNGRASITVTIQPVLAP